MILTTSEPIADLSHLGHVELPTPRSEESLHVLVGALGMTESGRDGVPVYLRGRNGHERYLGFRLAERIALDDGTWLTRTNRRCDFAYAREAHGVSGRFHHVTFALDSREEVPRAADVPVESGAHAETGPHEHTVRQAFFPYVREPGGNRVEVANADARLILAPAWQPITWTETERREGRAWCPETIESFHTRGTPPLEDGAGDDLSEKGIAS